MTINKTGKGTRNEKRCEEELKKLGYTTRRATRTKYHKIDFFGFDVMAISPDGHYMDFIQVKSNRCARATKDKIRELKMPHSCRKFVWIWVDRKGWKKERL